jgi:hypothetical protein
MLKDIMDGKSVNRTVFIKTEPLPKFVDGKFDEFSSRIISAPSKYEYALLL